MSRLTRILLLVGVLVLSSRLLVQADELFPHPPRATHDAPNRAEARPVRPHRPMGQRASAISFSQLQLTPPPNALAPLPERLIVGPTALALHRGPAPEYDVLARIPQGTELPVRSVLASGRWLEVEWQGQRGWVQAEQVRTMVLSPTP